MKLHIYNYGNGWRLPIGNYRNKKEKSIWVKLKFADGYSFEPTYNPDEKGKDYKKIFVNEGSFNKFVDDEGVLHLTLTVFNYELLTDIELTENNLMNEDGERYQTKLSDGESDMFGASTKIEEDDLPFY